MTLSRRRFVHGAGVAGLGLLASCGRPAGQAEPTARLPQIGYLSFGGSREQAPRVEAFRQGLTEQGYTDGQNLTVAYRFAAGNREQLRPLVAELVSLHPEVLVADSTVAALALKEATTVIPIVADSGDPIGSGLADSLPRPGGNVTGVASLSPELSGKRLELLKHVLPHLSRVGVLWYADGPAAAKAFRETEAAAGALGIQVVSMAVRSLGEWDSAFATAAEERSDALLQLQGGGLTANSERVVALAIQYHLPAMFTAREFVIAGGLMAYTVARQARDRRLAYYVDRILRGAKPADLPVEQPMRFDFLINLKTAQTLGLTIPEHVLLQATEVIQ